MDSWNRVLHRPLGDGYLIDIFAFLGIYALIRVVLSSIAHLRSLESQDKPDGQARLPDGAA